VQFTRQRVGCVHTFWAASAESQGGQTSTSWVVLEYTQRPLYA
jgi:hypothetical protein